MPKLEPSLLGHGDQTSTALICACVRFVLKASQRCDNTG